jgi:hypothetical protein
MQQTGQVNSTSRSNAASAACQDHHFAAVVIQQQAFVVIKDVANPVALRRHQQQLPLLP